MLRKPVSCNQASYNCRNCQRISLFLSFAVITTSSDSSKSQSAASAASTASTASDKTDEQNSDVAIATTNVRGTINLPVINGKISSWQKRKPQKRPNMGLIVSVRNIHSIKALTVWDLLVSLCRSVQWPCNVLLIKT